MTTLALVNGDLTTMLVLGSADLTTIPALVNGDLTTMLILGSADLMITRVPEHDDLMTMLVLGSGRGQGRDQTINVIAIVREIETSAFKVKTGEETIDAQILSATSALTQITAGDQQDHIIHALALTRVIPAGKAVHGRAVKLRQRSSRSIHRVPPTMNSSRAITNALITMRIVPHHVTHLIKVVDQKGMLHGASLGNMKRKSVMLHAYPMVASLKAHARCNARKLASGQKLLMIPKVSLGTSSPWQKMETQHKTSQQTLHK
jgi:hypothetical protein